jgi:hypothetical protein
MAANGRLAHRLFLLVSLTLLSGGAYAAYGEVRSYFSSGATPQERFAALAAGTQVAGPSIASARLLLDNCSEAMEGVYGTLQPKARRDAVAATCLAQADAITDVMPSFSYAWYIGAAAARATGDDIGFADRLREAQRTGPNEQWIAELRVTLAENNIDLLPEDVRRLNDADLALLVISDRGIASIADRYVQNPAFRKRITAIVEQLSEDEQARFVTKVEAAAGRAGASQ